MWVWASQIDSEEPEEEHRTTTERKKEEEKQVGVGGFYNNLKLFG